MILENNKLKMMFNQITFPGTSYPLIAGFTSRIGGVSQSPFASLNLGRYSDDPEVVKNYQLLRQAINTTSVSWSWLQQIHGNHIIEVFEGGPAGQGDGLITNAANLFLIVQTADCIPLLFVHQEQPFIAALHAGWRGLHKQIILEFRKRIQKRKFHPEDIHVGIGPHLKDCHFEVTKEFLEHFDSRFFHQKEGKYYFNPTHTVQEQLQNAGFLPENIKDYSRCTYCETDYYSYRRDGKTGRQIGFIGIA